MILLDTHGKSLGMGSYVSIHVPPIIKNLIYLLVSLPSAYRILMQIKNEKISLSFSSKDRHSDS